MDSPFDHPRFNASLFYPSPDVIRPVPGARDLRVEVAPGVRLHIKVHDLPDALAVVLLFHGNGETIPDYDSQARHYAAMARAGLAVVDYRGYGASEGTPTLRGCLHDAHEVLAAVLAAAPDKPLVIMGRSLGGACAAELCQEARPQVAGYIFESAPADLHGMLRRRGVNLGGPPSEADLEVFCPLRKLRRCDTPALVLHGERDTLIPATEARQTFDALAVKAKELVLIPGRGHNNVAYHPLYWEAVGRFVARVTSGASWIDDPDAQ